MNITSLPEDNFVQILSLTSPIDVLRLSASSKHLFSASECDTIWDNFLPFDCHDIISQSCSPLPQFKSKKHMCLHLCHYPIFLHDNTQSFTLDKWSGKKCYKLSAAKALQFTLGEQDFSVYSRYESFSASRFKFRESAMLTEISKLEIKGRFHAKKLSPHTTYGAYLVFQILITHRHTPNKFFPSKATMLEVDEDNEGPPRNTNHAVKIMKQKEFNKPPVKRGDRWLEIEMGRYHVGDIDSVGQSALVEMTLRKIGNGRLKYNVAVQCIELRPLRHTS